MSEGDWNQRVQWAIQAYNEWIPCRLDEPSRIYRTLIYGDLVQITTVDRQRVNLFPVQNDTDDYLGEEQMSWLEGEVENCTAQWFVLAQQTTFVPILSLFGGWGNSQDRLYAAIDNSACNNLVVLTGDIHTCTAANARDGGTAYGVEFTCGSITSPGAPGLFGLDGLVPNYEWIDGTKRGYMILTVDPTKAVADFWLFDDDAKNGPNLPPQVWERGYETADADNTLVPTNGPAAVWTDVPALVPES